EYVYFYSGSKKLATYEIGYYRPNNQTPFTPYFTLTGTNIYFGGKLIQAEGTPVVLDRLGSVVATVTQAGTVAHRYYPYGEERTSTANESTKFATYFRDKTTGMDYAVNRYFSNTMGRFTSPDPSRRSARRRNPQSWNRYGYVGNDPINRIDPLGLVMYDEYGEPIDEDDGGDLDYCDAFPDAIECGGDGVGGLGFGGPAGAAGSTGGIAHRPGSTTGPAGYTEALALLKNASKDCLNDLKASSSSQAVNRLQNTLITYDYGPVPIFDNNGRVTNKAAPAQTTGSGGISLNLNFGWLSPTNLVGTSTAGGPNLVDWLKSVGNSINEPNLSAGQYHELVLLHELGHLFGVGDDTETYNKSIFEDCIKGK
ncbi:MAG: RHS repeat-associated core domain-containing protein, partial [Chthonomonadales bacterium]